MISYAITVFIVFTIIYRYLNNKTTLAYMLMAMVMTPRISIMGSKVDGLYLVLGIVVIVVLAKQKGKVRCIDGYFARYAVLLMVIHVLYLISWMAFNRNSIGGFCASVAGSIKLIIFMWELLECNRDIKVDINRELYVFVGTVLVINLGVVAFQWFDCIDSSIFLRSVYLNTTEGEYLLETITDGRYTRYGGLFPYPMHMGLFMALVIGYMMLTKAGNNAMRIFFIAIALGLGYLSNTKSFLLGIAVILIVYILMACSSHLIEPWKLTLVILFIGGIGMMYAFFDVIYQLIMNSLGFEYATYFATFKNPLYIYYGRSITLASLIEVVKKYWLLGVGVDSLIGERVMDNAYLIIMHNGGIVALTGVLVFYFGLFRKIVFKRNLIIPFVLLFALGMGFQTLFATDITFWLLILFMWEATFGALQE